MKPKLFFVLNLLFFSFLNGQESKVYLMPDKQQVNSDIFEKIKENIENHNGVVVLYDSIAKNDTIIYKIGIKPDYSKQRNQYASFQRKIGEEFPLELFGIEKSEQPMLINFWFTSCLPCIKEIPDLNQLSSDYKDQVRFIAITFNSQIQVEKFLETRPIDFEHLTEQKDAIGEFGVRNYPMNILIDKNAKILYVDGALSYTLWEIEHLLKKELQE